MTNGVEVLYHSSIKISKDIIIYIDPYQIDKEYKDADIIFITHNHYDHYSEEDIDKVKKQGTIIVAPKDLLSTLLDYGFKKESIVIVEPDKEYKIGEIKFKTIPSYNINKKFHPKDNGWVGYIIDINKVKYFIAGDTDITEENKKVKCDIALIPIGGTYTMDYKEAAELVNIIKPKIAVPIHYGSIVGKKEDAINFSELLNKEIECRILMK